MDLNKAKQEFMKYVENFDRTQFHINRKILHSQRVADLCRQIAQGLNLTKAQTDLAELIGLLHDIGKFDLFANNNNPVIKQGMDHGSAGVAILKHDNYIRKFIEEDDYDSIIYTAIENHCKYKIEPNLTDEELLFAQLIRDADQIDILYQLAFVFFTNKPEAQVSLENSVIEDKFVIPFLEKRMIDRNTEFLDANKDLKFFLSLASFVFNINYDVSLNILKENNYVNLFFDRFDFKNPLSKKNLQIIRKSIDEYLG